MKKLLLALFGLCCGLSLFAAPVATGSTTPPGWYDDFEAAQAESAKTGRPMLVLFTGSDWCPYCVRLKRGFLDTAEFKKFAAEKLILVYLDFPNRADMPAALTLANRKIAGKFGIEGFPTTIVLDPKGKELGRIGGYDPNYLERVKRLVR